MIFVKKSEAKKQTKDQNNKNKQNKTKNNNINNKTGGGGRALKKPGIIIPLSTRVVYVIRHGLRS